MSEFTKVANLSDLPEGKGVCVQVNGRRVALFLVDGEVYAIDDICSHAEASLSEGELDGYEVECPLHGALFDIRTGRALCLPAFAPVDRFDVKVEGDDVLVAV